MVNEALSVGGLAGVLLSGAFMYWQVGRYAAPQVPRTLFDERKEVFAYTAGLFVGVPLALPLLFYLDALGFGALPAAAIDLALLVLGTEVAQWALLRTHYFGSGESGPFYALGFRAGISGLFALALVTQSLASASPSLLALIVAASQSAALLAVEVASGLLSVPGGRRRPVLGGSPVAGGLLGTVGLFLIGVGTVISPTGAVLGALAAGVGGAWTYLRTRDSVLGGVRPPKLPRDPEEPEEERSPYAPLDR